MSAPIESRIAVGTVLAGRYRLEASLGRGGMAEVFRATDVFSGRAVAVKVLRSQIAASREAVLRLRREGEVLSALRSPAIVAFEAVYETEGSVFLVMELLEGETLGARMRRGPMSPTELAPIVTGIVAGLSAAHARGVIHRDLKPDNVFLVPDVASSREGAIRVKLLDFGISKVGYGDKITQTGEVLGTPRYMSPEQLGAEVDIDARVDVYALGVILYEALSGASPFLASSPTDLVVAILHGRMTPLRSVRADVSPALEAVVMRAMARSRDARFATARELAEAFLDAAGIGEHVRLAPKRGLATRALGGDAVDEPSGVLHAQLPPDPCPGESTISPGTFAELPAFDAPASAATLLMPTAPSARAAHDEPARRSAVDRGEEPPTGAGPTMPGSNVAAAVALASTMEAPAPRDFPSPGRSWGLPPSDGRRSIPPTAVAESHALAPASRDSPSLVGSAPTRAGWSSTPLPAAVGTPAGSVATDPLAGIAAPDALAPRVGAWWWIALGAVGLLAGILSSASAIVLYRWWRPVEETAPPPPPLTSGSSDAGGADAPRQGPETVDAGGGDVEVPPRGADVSELPDAGRRRRGARAPSDMRSASVGRASTEERLYGAPPVERNDERTDLLSQATRALRSGDPGTCVELLDDLIARGATPMALRRRAECLMRLGEYHEAIRDYQRFCRIAPDHPGIREVREVLEGLGQSCP